MAYDEHCKKGIYRNVFFENELRKLINHETPKIIKQVLPFVNQKILNNGSVLNKKFKDSVSTDTDYKVNPLNEGDNAKIQYTYLTADYGSLKVYFRICFNGGKHGHENNGIHTQYCHYVEKVVYIGKIENDSLLLSVDDFEKLEIIDIEEEYTQFLKCQKLMTEYQRELSKLSFFKTKNFISETE